jgi:hypothetical protein
MLRVLIISLIIASGAFAQEGDFYGLQRGSVGVFVGGGPQINSGAHPSISGGVDFGLTKYVGLYADATGVLAYSANVGEFFGGGGVMVSASNKSRIVPFGRFGMDNSLGHLPSEEGDPIS